MKDGVPKVECPTLATGNQMNLDPDILLQGAIAYAVPLWLAGTGELVVQRSGVINIGIEGMMLCGALAAWAATMATGSAWVGIGAAMSAGLLIAAVFALVSIVYRADQIVAGAAINLLAVGLTGLGFKLCIDAGYAEREAKFFSPHNFDWLGFSALDQFDLAFVALLLAAIIHVVLFRTRFGIELRSLGEFPEAVDAAGISVTRRRVACVLFGGLTAGLAGSYLSIMFNTQFNENMTAGRGFLALAMVVFGRWHPGGLIAGGLFFGAIYWLATSLEVSPIEGMPAPQLFQMAPYLLSLIVLAGVMGKTKAPAALGRAFERE